MSKDEYIDQLHAEKRELVAAMQKVYDHRNLLLTRAGVAGYRQCEDGTWVCDPASQAFKELGEVLAKVKP